MMTNQDLDRQAARLLRQLKIDFACWEDDAPEKWEDAKETIKAALQQAQGASRARDFIDRWGPYIVCGVALASIAAVMWGGGVS